MELHIALKQLVETNGKEILFHPQLIRQLMDKKAFSENPSTKGILILAKDLGYIDKLYKNCLREDWFSQNQALAREFTSKCSGVNDDYVSYVFNCIPYSLDLLEFEDDDCDEEGDLKNKFDSEEDADEDEAYDGMLDLGEDIDEKDIDELIDSLEEEEDHFETDEYTITKQYHENKDIDIFVVRLTERVDEDTFKEYRNFARRHGKGYYSSFRGVNGFVFYTMDDAKAFVAELFINVKESHVVNSPYPRNNDSHSILKESQVISIKTTEENPLAQIVSKIVEQFGKDIIKDKRFINILADFKAFVFNPALRRILCLLIEEGHTKRWLEAGPIFDFELFIQKESNTLFYQYGFNVDLLSEIILDVCVPAGLVKSLKSPLVKNKANQLQDQSYEAFKQLCYSYYLTDEETCLKDQKGVLYSSNKEAVVSCGDLNSTSYSIRHGTKYIADHAFNRDYDEEIEDDFNKNVDLKAIHLPNSIISIGDNAFFGTNLQSLHIPSSVKYIGKWAFCYNNELSDLTIEDGVEYIGKEAFSETAIDYVTLPKSIRGIGSNAFPIGTTIINRSPHLTIYNGIMYDRNKTKLIFCYSKDHSVRMPNSVKEIGDEAFANNPFLTNIVLGDGVKIIGKEAFAFSLYWFNSNLKEIILSTNLEVIEDYAFENCANLYSIHIPKNVRYIGHNILKGSAISYVSCDSPLYEVVNDALYSKEESKLISYFGIDKEFTVKRGTKCIGKSAFEGNKSIERITLSDNLLIIEDSAFYGCDNLKELTIPDTVFNIGFAAIDKAKLKVIRLPRSLHCNENGGGRPIVGQKNILVEVPFEAFDSSITFLKDVENITIKIPKGTKQIYVSKIKKWYKSLEDDECEEYDIELLINRVKE